MRRGKIKTCARLADTTPVTGSNSLMRSISSPKNSSRIALTAAPPGRSLQHVPVHAKGAAEKSMSLRSYWFSTSSAITSSRSFCIPAQRQRHVLIFGRVAHGVDAGHRRDDDHVPPLGQRGGGAVAQAVDLVVDRGILFDIGIGRRYTPPAGSNRSRRRSIPPRCRETASFELGAELRRQRLVVRQHQRRPLHALDDVGHGEGLARPSSRPAAPGSKARPESSTSFSIACG